MDKNKLKQLAGIPVPLVEKKWSDNVDTKKQPPEGLFASGSKADIVNWLKDNHADFKSAMSALNFFINRAGKNLTADRRGVLENCKEALRKAYGVKESLEPFDMSILRRMAGLPVIQLIAPVVEKKDEEEVVDGSVDGEESAESSEEDLDLPEIVTMIAAKAEGKSGDELAALINQVYDAGVKDGLAQAEEKEDGEDKEVKETPSVSEAATLTFSFNIDDEAKAAKACIILAKAGLTVDMEEALGVFYFNFKNAEQLAKAKKIVGIE
jgi:hypothetical protein